MKHFGLLAAAAAAAMVPSAPAQAAIYLYELTGDYVATFELDTDYLPDDYADGLGLIYWDILGNFPGALFPVADIWFFNSGIGGGMEIDDYYGGSVLLVTDGPQLYSGPEGTPTLLTGTFSLTEYGGPGTYTLKVTDLSAVAIPEPASWAMMIGGFGLMGGLMRRRQRQNVTVSYA